jgi:hypothetical protein
MLRLRFRSRRRRLLRYRRFPRLQLPPARRTRHRFSRTLAETLPSREPQFSPRPPPRRRANPRSPATGVNPPPSRRFQPVLPGWRILPSRLRSNRPPTRSLRQAHSPPCDPVRGRMGAPPSSRRRRRAKPRLPKNPAARRGTLRIHPLPVPSFGPQIQPHRRMAPPKSSPRRPPSRPAASPRRRTSTRRNPPGCSRRMAARTKPRRRFDGFLRPRP